MKHFISITFLLFSFAINAQEDSRDTPMGQAKCEAAKKAQKRLRRLYSIHLIQDSRRCQYDTDCTNGFVGGLCPQPANIESVATYKVYMESTTYKELNKTIMKNCYVAMPGCALANRMACRNNKCIGLMDMPRGPIRPIRDTSR